MDDDCGEADDSRALALDWLEADERPRLILDDRLIIVWRNNAADAFIAAEPDLEVREGRLHLRSSAAQVALVQALRVAQPSPSSLVIHCTEGRGTILAKLRLLKRASGRNMAGLRLWRPEKVCFHFADFRLVFGLTTAEQRVLLALLEGFNAEEISRRNKVSVDTVRSHIRRIYDKVGVSTREGLFRCARPYLL